MNMILAVLLTLIVVGGATGAAMYRVLDRGGSASTTEDGAVVEPIYETPSPTPEEVEPTRRPTPTRQRTPEPTTIIIVPHTASPTPFSERTEEPDEDEQHNQTDEPSPGPH